MVRLRPGWLCVIPLSWGFAGTSAQAQQPGFSQAAIHEPWSAQYVPLTPVGRRSAVFGSFSSGSFSSGYYSPGSYPLYPYPSLYGYGPTFGPFYGPLPYGGVLQPVWIPPGALFGPQAVMRFIGAAPAIGPVAPPVQPQAQQPAGGFGMLAADPPLARPAQKPRATNADARARSQRFIVLGDGYFAKQAYSDASQRYKLAAQAAPDMADGFFRQGIALVALGHYEAAARSLKRGLTIKPDWADSDFRLDMLYGDNGLAKAAHIEALAQEARRAPSADILFLLGVMLYFDGAPERAKPFFVRSRELAAGDDAHLEGFLRQVLPAVPADQAPAPAPEVDAGAATARRPPSVAPFSKLPSPAAAMPAPRALGQPQRVAPSKERVSDDARDL
jgi:hypothetical protein